MRYVCSEKRLLDKGELTQLMIIIAGLAIAAVVTIGAISSVMLNKGESAAGCISESSGFKSGSDSARECRNMEEEAKVSSSGVIAGSFGSAAESEAATSRSQKISKQKEDFVELSKLLEEFKKKNGRYPVLNDETKSLNFVAQEEAYADFEYNLHYCPSPDGKNYVLAGYTRTPDNKGMYITYASNKGDIPRSYYTPSDQMRRVNEKNEDIGGGSYCYNGSEGSVADRAGVTGIGGDVVDMGNNRFIVPKPGWSGINPPGKGFANAKK